MPHRNYRGENSASISTWVKLTDCIFSIIHDGTQQMRSLQKKKTNNPGGTLRMYAFKEKYPIEATCKIPLFTTLS